MFNKNGYLFDNNKEDHYLKDKDIENLIDFFNGNEKKWQENIGKIAKDRLYYDDFLLDEISLLNADGTIIKYPFGKRVLSFKNGRHFFRGENQIYPSSLPSLDRKIKNKSTIEKELYHALSCLRIERFTNFLWKFKAIPYWETKSEINYKALAQHYGFKTHLMDLTNNFMVALFFATSRYDSITDSYFPLTFEDINQSEDTKYGVIYHAPNFTIDYPFGMSSSELYLKMQNLDNKDYEIDSGLFDGIAFQIGYQPLLRCKAQGGYVMSLKNGKPINENSYFEKLLFKQSPELSKKIFELMDGGRKIFPNEGILKAHRWIDEIKDTFIFTKSDIDRVYDVDINRSVFNSKDEFIERLLSFSFNNHKISIADNIDYDIPKEIIDAVNESANINKIFDELTNVFYKSDDLEYFENRYNILYNVSEK